MPKAKKPVHEVRLGRIKAAIWENEGDNGIRHNVTITRLYKNGDDEWKDSSSFGRDDLPLVEKVCHMTHLWIFSQTQGGIVQNTAAGGSSGDEPF
jgi:hypothetical protein